MIFKSVTDFEQQSYVSINNSRSRLTGQADWRSASDSIWGTTTNIYQHMQQDTPPAVTHAGSSKDGNLPSTGRAWYQTGKTEINRIKSDLQTHTWCDAADSASVAQHEEVFQGGFLLVDSVTTDRDWSRLHRGLERHNILEVNYLEVLVWFWRLDWERPNSQEVRGHGPLKDQISARSAQMFLLLFSVIKSKSCHSTCEWNACVLASQATELQNARTNQRAGTWGWDVCTLLHTCTHSSVSDSSWSALSPQSSSH